MQQGTFRKLLGKWKYTFHIQQFTSAGFKSCSELKRTVGKASYREGGALVPIKIPALVDFEDITLTRGVCFDRDMYDWCQQVCSITNYPPGGGGYPDEDLMRTSRLVHRDRDEFPLINYKFEYSWPGDYSAGDFDNDAGEVSMESFVLVFHYWDREDVGSQT